ncbi:MAG: UTP--glucose-1-phosphate uridylyltransferase GalU [Candidatus Saccharimonadales bacterium]
MIKKSTLPVTQAVIAAAGFGSRFLPFSKAIPKEMLPLVDKPVIQHIVEELVHAGIHDIIIVTSDGKAAIKEHFSDTSASLRQNLLMNNKTELLMKTDNVAKLASITFVQQSGPYGNATPILNAAHLIRKNEPFIYAFADDFVSATPNRFEQLVEVNKNYGGSVLTCVRHNEPADYTRYGYVGGITINNSLIGIDTIIEKPGSSEESPSDLASVGGYLLEYDIIDYVKDMLLYYDTSKEFQIQDAMQHMISDGHRYYGCEIIGGRHYDTGNPLEYMKTVYDFACSHPDIGKEFMAYVLERNHNARRPQKHHYVTRRDLVNTNRSHAPRPAIR